MTHLASFAAGVVTGWLARSTVDSTRDAVVTAVGGAYGLVERTRRAIATEREFLSDLIAEARSRAHVSAARPAVDVRAAEPGAVAGEQHG